METAYAILESGDHAESSLARAIELLKSLKDGWDSYGAPAPAPIAIENASSLVVEAQRLATCPDRIEPSAMGGVGVTFSSSSREVVIEFYNQGTAHALFTVEVSGDMRTLAVQTNPNGYRAIIDEVRKYLYGE